MNPSVGDSRIASAKRMVEMAQDNLNMAIEYGTLDDQIKAIAQLELDKLILAKERDQSLREEMGLEVQK